MKKLIAVALVAFAVGVAFATDIMLNYSNRSVINSASNRVVCVANPEVVTVGSGTLLIDETYTLQGTKSTINSSINIRVE